MSKKGDINNLNATELGNLQAKLKDVLYFIIDEKSLIGLRLLASISYRMGEIWPRYRDQPFGGRSVVLIGDFFQLPPVAERALYSNNAVLGAVEIAGRNIYRAFRPYHRAQRGCQTTGRNTGGLQECVGRFAP